MTKKRKSRHQRAQERQKPASPEVLRRQGAEAFHKGDYELAIAAWRRISSSQRDARLTTAFAEACFRRGLQGHLDSLRQAVSLSGDEPRYVYHLALAHHRAGQRKEAEPLYRQTLDQPDSDSDLFPRAAYALGLLLLETRRRPSRDPLWKRLQGAADGSPLTQARQRLNWAESLIFNRSASSDPAPGPLWEALAARLDGQNDPISLAPGDMTRPVAAAAFNHLAARAWERGDAESAFTHWRAAYDAPFDLPALKDNLFAAARTVATERLKVDDVGGALEAASAGLAIQPLDNGLQTIAVQAHFRLGHAAATTGRWDEAYDHWQAALDAGGERGRRLVINLALAEEQREDWHAAAELWREALRRRPRKADHPDALDDAQVARLWRHVAENYQRVGDLYEAQTTFQNALKWAPDDVGLRTAYVNMLLDDGRLVAADNQLDLLLRAHPNDVDLLTLRAQVYDGQGYTYAAVDVCKQILKLQPDHASARHQIARYCEKMGDDFYSWGWVQEAMNHYQEGLEYTPDDGMLIASLGMCHLDLGDEKTARQFFDRAHATEPGNPDVYLLVIKTWLDHDNWAAAQAVIQRAREAMELSPAFFLEIAGFCYSVHRLDLAQDYVAEARALAAGDVNLLLVIADVVGRNGDYELAEEVAREVLKLAPDNPLAHLLKGLALASQHKLKAARRSWDKAEQIARQTNNRGVLMAVEEVRFMYDPDHGPPLDFLRRIMGTTFFDDEDEFDDDEEWFYE
jgi:tetratricopeptide (TPR) repeat protein